MAKLSCNQTYCGTCKDWESNSREVNMWGQIYIPNSELYGRCLNEHHRGEIRKHRQVCPFYRPLNLSMGTLYAIIDQS